ncbi:Yip4p KNAG_0G01400 [Huiozyma naganishii CBS 8797]|uniref:Protein YIP n=1 Tax=Huiozyma naganishii (strain ATCC MYA-139 / BCRC 22969 / CBS 8797 / KCTC 17520 / NBRC 10181 / NCYC 3082 / Yp74L-3) TaxID=1071383 RepID=J7RNQ0_HUIN7|nr:hypothetical protein KNAG_0G01400 [Kazachstania naganishii CBS 8797]CCK71198.1 hypothetical protein KNAG_0G01400 [Kazachstania naganishii CBS 8797]
MDSVEADFTEPDVAAAGIGLQGQMAPQYNRGTLDETVIKTLKRDVLEINARLKMVVYPHFPTRAFLQAAATSEQQQGSESIDSHCDMWAPLTFVIVYSLCVSHAKALFSSIFVCCWFVLLVMALHLRLAKPYDNVSVISYVSLSGYCLFPQMVNAVAVQTVLPLVFRALGRDHRWAVRGTTALKLLSLAACMVWSLTAISLVTKSKGFVQIFPLGLCLLALGWISTAL